MRRHAHGSRHKGSGCHQTVTIIGPAVRTALQWICPARRTPLQAPTPSQKIKAFLTRPLLGGSIRIGLENFRTRLEIPKAVCTINVIHPMSKFTGILCVNCEELLSCHRGPAPRHPTGPKLGQPDKFTFCTHYHNKTRINAFSRGISGRLIKTPQL
jgi:hypothetical protein